MVMSGVYHVNTLVNTGWGCVLFFGGVCVCVCFFTGQSCQDLDSLAKMEGESSMFVYTIITTY